jgi:hypothetical protein
VIVMAVSILMFCGDWLNKVRYVYNVFKWSVAVMLMQLSGPTDSYGDTTIWKFMIGLGVDC